MLPKSGGSLRLIDVTKHQGCTSAEKAIAFAQRGPKGATGTTGKTGLTGKTGATGLTGPGAKRFHIASNTSTTTTVSYAGFVYTARCEVDTIGNTVTGVADSLAVRSASGTYSTHATTNVLGANTTATTSILDHYNVASSTAMSFGAGSMPS